MRYHDLIFHDLLLFDIFQTVIHIDESNFLDDFND